MSKQIERIQVTFNVLDPDPERLYRHVYNKINSSGYLKRLAQRDMDGVVPISIVEMELYCADLKRSEFHLFRGIAKQVVMDAARLHKIVLKLRRESVGSIRSRACGRFTKWDCPPYVVLAVDEVALLKKRSGTHGRY